MRPATCIGSQRGQSSVEFLALVPAFLLACAIAWEVVLAGHTLWLAAHAARAGARAVAVGDDGLAAARSAVPRSMRRGLSLSDLGGGRVRVRVALPLLLGGWRGPVRVAATAGLVEAR